MKKMQQQTNEWFTARSGKFTASRFADLLTKPRTKGEVSKTRQSCILDVVTERLTGKYEESFSSDDMRNGHIYEPLARNAYEVSTGNFVTEVGFIQHKNGLLCGASPDGLIGLDGGIEAKCPKAKTHMGYLLLTEAPKIYTPQIQGGLWITEREWWDFISFNPNFPPQYQLKIIRVYRDEELIKTIETEVLKALHEADQIINELAKAA